MSFWSLVTTGSLALVVSVVGRLVAAGRVVVVASVVTWGFGNVRGVVGVPDVVDLVVVNCAAVAASVDIGAPSMHGNLDSEFWEK